MKKTRKNLPQELEVLQNRLRTVLRANMEEVRRTAQLLGDAERKVEDRFGQLDSLETIREIAARKFRKSPTGTLLPASKNAPNIERPRLSIE